MSLENILLGLLREAASGYDLKTEFNQTVNYFWPAELSQIYRTLKRLEAAGHLQSRIESSDRGPDRRVYALTVSGHGALRAWLDRAPAFSDERHTYLAQLFFMAELDDLESTLVFVERVREKRAAQLATYRRIERDWLREIEGTIDNAPDHEFHQYLTLRSGLTTTAARLRWCDETIERIRDRIEKKKRKRTGNKRVSKRRKP